MDPYGACEFDSSSSSSFGSQFEIERRVLSMKIGYFLQGEGIDLTWRSWGRRNSLGRRVCLFFGRELGRKMSGHA